jgi:hypothetical protein
VTIAGSTVTTILSCFVAVPAAFAAMTVKLYVPAVVGVPVINPVPVFRLKPPGREPLTIDQVIGVEPVAASL